MLIVFEKDSFFPLMVTLICRFLVFNNICRDNTYINGIQDYQADIVVSKIAFYGLKI